MAAAEAALLGLISTRQHEVRRRDPATHTVHAHRTRTPHTRTARAHIHAAPIILRTPPSRLTQALRVAERASTGRSDAAWRALCVILYGSTGGFTLSQKQNWKRRQVSSPLPPSNSHGTHRRAPTRGQAWG